MAADDDRVVDDVAEKDGPTKKRASISGRREEADLLLRAADVKRKREQAKRIEEARKMSQHPECVKAMDKAEEGIF